MTCRSSTPTHGSRMAFSQTVTTYCPPEPTPSPNGSGATLSSRCWKAMPVRFSHVGAAEEATPMARAERFHAFAQAGLAQAGRRQAWTALGWGLALFLCAQVGLSIFMDCGHPELRHP